MLVNFMVLNILFRAVVCEVHFRVLNIYTMGRRKTSVVWDHFVIKSVVNGNKKYQVATCVVCQEDTKFSRNTTNQMRDANEAQVNEKRTKGKPTGA